MFKTKNTHISRPVPKDDKYVSNRPVPFYDIFSFIFINVFNALGVEEGEQIEHKMLSSARYYVFADDDIINSNVFRDNPTSEKNNYLLIKIRIYGN